MKAIAGILIAGALAGAVVVSTGAGRGAKPLAAPGEGAPAPVNPYNGMQEREEVYAFTQKPKVTKQGDKWIITFASKGKCDATVSVVDGKGKIVRHLASGVLGSNAPHPFQQNSLSQKVEWDGLTDDFKKAPAGCKVKVSLGLKAEFDKIEKQSLFSSPRGMAVDKDGHLYYATANGVLSESVHVFDRGGKLVRTIWPQSAAVPPEKNSLFTWNKTTGGQPVPMRNRFGGGWSFDITPGYDFFNNARRATAAAAPDGRVLFLSAGGERGPVRLLFLDAKDGSCPTGSFVDLGNVQKGGIATSGIAIPPGGKWIYFAGKVSGHGSPGASHAVQRAPLDKPGASTVFVGEVGKPGDDNAHFNGPTSIACDKDGNVYVGDTGNKRIQIYKPDGSHLKTIPNVYGGIVGVSHKTGAVYCMQQSDKWPKPMVITKLGGLGNPAKAAEITLGLPRGGEGYTSAMAAVDSLSEPPAIWFVGLFRAKPAAPALAVRIEDRGDKLVQAVNVLEANGLSKETGEADGGLHSHQYYIAADKRSGVLAAGGVNAVGPDGLWYSRAQSMGAKVNWIVRRDPKNDVYVPFEVDGKQASLWWSAKNKWVHNGKPVIGIEIDYHAHGPHGFQSPFDVAPNGDIYAMSTTAKTHLENMTKAGIFNTGKTEAFHHMVLVYGPDGKLKSPAALTGLWDTDGLRVGRSGAVYVVQGVHALDQALPDGLAAGGKFHGSRWGSLVKFNSAFDKYPVGRMVGMWEGKDAEGATHKLGGRKVKFENALWTYGGVSPVSAAPGGCTCLKSSFDLDLYERSFVPAAQTCSVNVIDSNGNVAARLGGYGNLHDLITAKKLAFDIPRSVAVTDEAMWVHDCQHRAVVKAKLSYHTEETVGLDGRASISTSPPVSSAPVVPKTSAAPVAPAAEKPVSEEAPALSAAARAPAPRPAARDAEAAARSLLLMGMNYKRAGRAGQARKYFQRVLDEHPNTEFAARAKREQASL